MTLKEVYIKGKKMLSQMGIYSSAFESTCLFEYCFDMSKQRLVMDSNSEADCALSKKFFELIDKRLNGEPLQYILGKWNFMGLDFYVGDGVLIPRDDTEVLVVECINRLKNISNPKILDLCAGSGAVGISVASKIKDAQVYCLELSDIAYGYLKKNISLNSITNVTAIQGNVFSNSSDEKFMGFDAIISNPPYIPTGELKSLQKEVQKEPTLALDGGEDGLRFYREIAQRWSHNLNVGGIIAVEIGIDQSNSVVNIFKDSGLTSIKTLLDINGITRVVSGVKLA